MAFLMFPEKLADLSILYMEFSVRVNNCLEKGGMKYIKDLFRKSDAELLMIPGFGEALLKAVLAILEER